jgi:PilZ domain
VRPTGWSLSATMVAAVLFFVGGHGTTDSEMRLLGFAGGGMLAVAGAALGFVGMRRARGLQHEASTLPPTRADRFLLDRRRAPRHDTRLPVQFSVNGRSYPATLINVSANGALLRLRIDPGETVTASVGQAVNIEDYPAGTLARIGRSGVYVDFAVRFEAVPQPLPRRRSLVETTSSRGIDP